MRTCLLTMLLLLASCDRRESAKPPAAASTRTSATRSAAVGEAAYYAAPGGKTVGVSGTIVEIAQLPKRRSPLYRDALVAARVVDLTIDGVPLQGREMLVYGWGLRETVPTKLSTLQKGDRVTLKVQAWSAVSRRFDSIPKSELPATGDTRNPLHFGDPQ
jgi:hypothetical protein